MSESVIRKVRALLAKAEASGVTPEEAEAFSRKAEELIARHAIDQAMLDAKKHKHERPELRRFNLSSPYHKPKAYLLNGVALAFGCKLIYHNRTKFNAAHCRVVGFPSDLDAVDLLYNSLMIQAMSAMLAEDTGYEHGKTFRASFMYAFASRVQKRLAETKERASQQSQADNVSTALVLRDRSQEVAREYERQFSRVGKTTSAARSQRGYQAGDAAGARADIGASRIGGARSALDR